MLIVIAVQPLNNEIIQLSSNSLVFLPDITSTKSASPATVGQDEHIFNI